MGGPLMISIILAVAFVVGAPLFGGLLAGADRIVTARMQGRVGPPVLQPFYDVGKLLEKQTRRVNPIAEPLLLGHVVFMAAAGVLIIGGGDLVFAMFVLALAGLFLVLAAGSADSPYSHAGASRELVVLLASEPFLILMAAAICKATGESTFQAVMSSTTRLAVVLPGVVLAFLIVITIKLRKSPFDISASHHAHQELVQGIATDMSGRQLVWVTLAHWYESAILAVLVVLFFNWSVPLGLVVFLIAYLLEVLVDNSTSRAKWPLMLRSTWMATLLLSGGNLLALFVLGW
jgi:ech hydrogenase subunit B